jgi:hypothetical protein
MPLRDTQPMRMGGLGDWGKVERVPDSASLPGHAPLCPSHPESPDSQLLGRFQDNIREANEPGLAPNEAKCPCAERSHWRFGKSAEDVRHTPSSLGRARPAPCAPNEAIGKLEKAPNEPKEAARRRTKPRPGAPNEAIGKMGKAPNEPKEACPAPNEPPPIAPNEASWRSRSVNRDRQDVLPDPPLLRIGDPVQQPDRSIGPRLRCDWSSGNLGVQ